MSGLRRVSPPPPAETAEADEDVDTSEGEETSAKELEAGVSCDLREDAHCGDENEERGGQGSGSRKGAQEACDDEDGSNTAGAADLRQEKETF